MKKTLTYIAAATFFAASFTGAASAASMNEMMDGMKAKMACSAACNSEYSQCVAAKSDYTFSAEMVAERTKMNMMAPVECGQANMQCNSAC